MSQENQVPRRVGEQLRQAREQQGIAITEAAERLHILASYIKAMEAGRYGALPGTVFLRGYVRSYARFLQLDADEMVAQLDRELGAAKEESPAPGPVAEPVKPVVAAGKGKLIGIVAALLVVGIGLAWYLQQPKGEGEAPARPTAQAPHLMDDAPADTAPEADLDYDPDSGVPVDRPAAYDDGDQGDTGEEPAASGEGNVASERSPAQGVPAESKAAETVPSAKRGESRDQPGTAPQVEAPRVAGAINETAADEAGASDDTVVARVPDRLEVTFSGESWFELTDADGKRRVGLFRDGQRLIHQGPAPFQIVVGAVSETSITFNGTPVDFSKYRVRNNRVGLTLGQ